MPLEGRRYSLIGGVDQCTRMTGARRPVTIVCGVLRGESSNSRLARSNCHRLAQSLANTRQRPVRFHASRRAPPLHSMRQGFENAGVCFLASAVGQLIWAFVSRLFPNCISLPFKFSLRRSPFKFSLRRSPSTEADFLIISDNHENAFVTLLLKQGV